MTVTMVLGPPASGKSSISKDLLNKNPNTLILNRDTEGGTIASLLPKMESLLQNNQDIILDNLFPTVEVRKPFIDMAKRYNVEINAKVMGTSIEDSTFNFVQRMINLTGKFLSPEEIKKSKHPNIFPPCVLFKYKKEFQKSTTQEGFSKIETVPFIRKDNPEFINKALFLDYDATIRECVGGNGKYPVSEDQVKLLPKRKEVIQSYKDKGYILIGVSNQSGVAKGELTYEKADQLFIYTNKLLGIDIDYKFCSHQSAPISCYCRKPQVGTFVYFMMKYKLSRKYSIMVGDLTSDRTFATRCGIQYIDQLDFFR